MINLHHLHLYNYTQSKHTVLFNPLAWWSLYASHFNNIAPLAQVRSCLRPVLGLPVSQHFSLLLLLLLLLFTVRLEQLQEKSIKENNSLGESTSPGFASSASPSVCVSLSLPQPPLMMHDSFLHDFHVISCCLLLLSLNFYLSVTGIWVSSVFVLFMVAWHPAFGFPFPLVVYILVQELKRSNKSWEYSESVIFFHVYNQKHKHWDKMT